MVQNKKMKLDHKKPEALNQINFDFYGPFAVAFLVVYFFQGSSLMHGDMIGFVALDFVLGLVVARVMGISFVKDVFRMHLDDFSTDMASL